MATLSSPFNDVWPVASWSSRDYFGRWKALHYYARDAYSPVAALPIVEDDILKVYGVSDLPEETKVTVQVRAVDFDGKVLSDVTKPDVVVPTDSSRMIWQGYLKTVLNKQKMENVVVEITLKNAEGKLLNRRLFYLCPSKKLILPKAKISLKVEQVNDGYQLTLNSGKLAKNDLIGTETDGFFSENYFDLLPGENKTILFKTQSILDDPQGAFRVKSLVDTYD